MQGTLSKSLAIGGAMLALVAAAPGFWPSFDPDGPCEDVAGAQRRAAESAAQADLWLAAALARNAPASQAKSREQQARAAYDEALDLAKAQFQARTEVCEQLGGDRYDPNVSPPEFSTTIDNVYFPHVPGQTLVYEGDSAAGFVHNEVTTTFDHVVLGGFTTRAIEDVVTLDGVLHEHATDYFAQRSDGSVWYFGEVSRTYEDGLLDNLDGSWRVGKDEAKAGVLMLAPFHVGDAYRQEYLIDVAEDVAVVLATDETVVVPYGTFTHCLKTLEFSPMEPDASEWKFYAPGIGLVLIVDLETGERLELVAIQ